MRTSTGFLLHAGLAAFGIALPASATAQLISLKTVPVAAGDQFLVYPSKNLGMGGLSIALEDPWLDPFVNPAKGTRLTGPSLFGAPVFFSVSDGDGSGRTLPLGGLFGSRDWFAGFSFSLQQLEAADQGLNFVGPIPQGRLLDQTATNTYLFGMAGRSLGSGRGSIAASISYASLDAVDGVDLLYALSQSIEQSGHMVDYRVGYYNRSQDDRAFEALLVHNRFNMTHDVTYLDWLPALQNRPAQWSTRVEENLDRTNTWGLHFGYTQPITGTPWRVGGIVTSNWKSHPKIPNYEIMNIPRDPGNSWAYNFGIGLARQDGPAVFGIEVIYEPIWSETWAEAEDTVRSSGGQLLAKGDKTVENDFRFSNATLRMGIGRETDKYALQLGLHLRSISYNLDQVNNVTRISREQDESWMEWTPTWGGSLKFPEFELRYMGRRTTGTGRPSVQWTGVRGAALDVASASDVIVAPSGPLTLQEARVTTHQISISLPLR